MFYHNYNMVKLTEISIGVSMKMPYEIAVKRKERDKEAEEFQYLMNRLDDKEAWEKAFETAAKDDELNADLWETDEDVKGLYKAR